MYVLIALLAIGVIAGMVMTSASSPLNASGSENIFQANVNGSQTVSQPNGAEIAPCPHREEVDAIEIAYESRLETVLSLDLTEDNVPAFLEFLIVPADQPTYLTNGDTKPAQKLEIGDEVLMTGEKQGIVQSVEIKEYAPDASTTTTDNNGNGYRRVLAKSKRFVEDILHLHVADEVIKTTPEHPFYVNGAWVEAKDLMAGNKIRSQNGMGIAVERIER